MKREPILLSCIAFISRLLSAIRGAHRASGLYDTPPLQRANDTFEYVQLARTLRFHHTFGYAPGIPTEFRPPLYPALISLLWWGDSVPLITVLIVQVVLGILTVLLTYKLAEKHLGRRVAFLSGLMLSVAPMTVYFTGLLYTETLFTFLLVLGCYWWGKGFNVLCGLAFGFAWLTRTTMGPFILTILLIGALGKKRSLVIIALVSVLAPGIWTMRNYLTFGEIVPVASAGNINLLLGTVRVSPLERDGEIWKVMFSHPVVIEAGKGETGSTSLAVRSIKAEPWEWLKTRALQMVRLFIDDGDYISYNKYTLPELLRWPFRVGNLLFTLIALAGLYILRSRLWELLHITLFPAYLALIHLPLWTEPRYFLPAMPFCIILVAVVVNQLITHRHSRLGVLTVST